jgi:hypothetical protein
LLFNLLSSNCCFHLEEGIDGSVVTDITAEDLSEMGLTLKLGTRKKLLSFLQNLGKSSTPTQDGPAATTPSKVYVPASTASTGVYESAATPTADEANNIQQLVTSASTGVNESDASTQTEAHIQQLLK